MGLPYMLAEMGSAASRLRDSTAVAAGVLTQRWACALACGFWLPWDLGNAVLCSAGLTTASTPSGNRGRDSWDETDINGIIENREEVVGEVNEYRDFSNNDYDWDITNHRSHKQY
jgi:hypothetical protein